jgi:3-dehydroquinate dehydratase-2
MPDRLFVLNGADLNMLGRREPHSYGRVTPAGLSTRSVALLDALRMIERPVVDVHISNVFGREPLYGELLTARAATGFLVLSRDGTP